MIFQKSNASTYYATERIHPVSWPSTADFVLLSVTVGHTVVMKLGAVKFALCTD
jgi:hypothetical protein